MEMGLGMGSLHNGRDVGAAASAAASPTSLLAHVLSPTLPPLLAPVPSICRLLALLIMLPIVAVCMIDFAGYAIFRTLGFQRRRVRVKRGLTASAGSQTAAVATAMKGSSSSSSSSSSEKPSTSHARTNTAPAISPSLLVRAPLLQPGAYDAETLLRHRARSVSGEGAEAEAEWSRTGGQFARVSHVRAIREAAAAAAAAAAATKPSSAGVPVATTSRTEGSQPPLQMSDGSRNAGGTAIGHGPMPSLTPPESPTQAFSGVGGVGVEGALGFFDTDAEDSGTESAGRDSPEARRSPVPSFRRGLTGSSLGFTPVDGSSISTSSSERDQQRMRSDHTDSGPSCQDGPGDAAAAPGRDSVVGSSSSRTITAGGLPVIHNDRSPRSAESSASSWVGVDESSGASSNSGGESSYAAAAATPVSMPPDTSAHASRN